MFDVFTTILHHVQGMWRYRWQALLTAWLLFITGWLVVYAMPNIYQAKASVYIDTDSLLKPLLEGLAIQPDVTERVDMMTRALLSGPNLEEVAREAGLDLQNMTPVEQQGLLRRLEERIVIAQSQGMNIYEIRFEDTNRKTARQVVQVLLNKLIEETLGATRTDTTMAQTFLEEQIAVYESRLTEAEQRLSDFKREHVGMMPSDERGYYVNLQEAIDNLAQTRTALGLAVTRRDQLRAQLQGHEPVFMLAESTAPGTTATYSPLDARIQELQKQLDQLRLQFTDQHPDVVALMNVIEQVKQRRAEEPRVRVQSPASDDKPYQLNPIHQSMVIALSQAEIDVSTLQTKEAAQDHKVVELKASVDVLPDVEAQLSRLNRDYEVTKTQYETLVTRLESARLSEEAGQNSDEVKFRVIEPPRAAVQPIGPDRLLFLTVVLFGSLAAGAAFAFFLHQVRPVFFSTTVLRQITELPVLGVVSIKRGGAQLLKQRTEMASLLLALGLLICVCGGAMVFQDAGSRAIQALIEKSIQS